MLLWMNEKHLMKKQLFPGGYILVLLLLSLTTTAVAQSNATKSILINIGSTTTSSPSADPVYLTTFSNVQLGTVFPNATVLSDNQVFATNISNKAVAYNSAIDTIYTIENLTASNCKFYPYGFGEPYSWSFPGIPAASNFTFPAMYNTEFDNRFENRMWYITNLTTSGFRLNSMLSDGWPATGRTTDSISFPAAALPTGAVGTNDLVITPNNRMFLVIGGNGDLYEVLNYTTASPSIVRMATAGTGIRISSMAYLDGNLLLASYSNGSDAYKYNIASNTMTGPFAFPGNSRRYAEPAPAVSQPYATVDATSTTLAVATAHRLKTAYNCHASATLTYEVMLKNIGKMDMATPQIIEDLGAAFPGGTLSMVTVTAVSNPAGLALNAAYNGTTNTSLIDNTIDKPLNSGTKGTDSVLLEVSFTVTGLTPGALYTINAVGSGKAYYVVAGTRTVMLSVTDTSNNGPASVSAAYDPNNNGVADDPGETTTTSYIFEPPAAGDPCVLPLELLAFNVSRKEAAVQLDWSTASEQHSAYFVIERSNNGKQWNELQQVPAAGNSSTGLQYTREDREPLAGMSYYRLKMVDLDNSYTYSPVRNVNRTDGAEAVTLQAFPNPGTGRIMISNVAGAALVITNVMGQVLQIPVVYTGQGQATIDLSGQAPGIYWIRCADKVVRVLLQ